MINIDKNKSYRIQQGDIFSDIEFLESSIVIDKVQEINKIVFPYSLILTQDCDLESNSRVLKSDNENSILISIIVVPIYNWKQFILGEHLSKLDYKMNLISKKKEVPAILNNKNPRYHYLKFPETNKIYIEAVIDFKHYFTVTYKYLADNYNAHWVFKVKELYREDISQRFSAFLSRIGLP